MIDLSMDIEVAITVLAAVRSGRRAHGTGTPQGKRLLIVEEALARAIEEFECPPVVERPPQKVAGMYTSGSGV